MLNVVGTGPDLAAARDAAYRAASRIRMRGGWYRTDIAPRRRPAMTSGGAPPQPGAAAAGPPRARPGHPAPVTTIELFFDLVFAFTLTQLTALLDVDASLPRPSQVLLIFTLIWWMYAGYAWLTNACPPVTAAERLLLLVGMGGLLIAGLAIPQGFGRAARVLGLGYLVVVLVHAYLYRQVNQEHPPDRAVQHRLGAAGHRRRAGVPAPRRPRPVVYVAVGRSRWPCSSARRWWCTPRGLFGLQPAHIVERHTRAGHRRARRVGRRGRHRRGQPGQRGGMSVRLVGVALLGLALSAALWWALFGGGEDERAERALAAADTARRTGVVLTPTSTPTPRCCSASSRSRPGSSRRSRGRPTAPPPSPPGRRSAGRRHGRGAGRGHRLPAAARPGSAWPARPRRPPPSPRSPAGLYAGLPVQLALLAAMLAAMIVAEQRARRQPPGVAAG